jgi:hypothetical protein
MSLPNHKLIEFSDIQSYRAISQNVTQNRIDPYIIEAQDLDFRGLVGKDFYNVLFEQVLPATLPPTYKYADLKPQYAAFIAYHAYARFLTQNQITSTDHSIVRKTNDWSEPVSDANMTKAINAARASAVEYGNRFIDYMNDNVSSYPEWENSPCWRGATSGNAKGVAKIGAVKGNRSQWQR